MGNYDIIEGGRNEWLLENSFPTIIENEAQKSQICELQRLLRIISISSLEIFKGILKDQISQTIKCKNFNFLVNEKPEVLR